MENREAPRGLQELAFRMFWGWVNHPDEKAARTAWENNDTGSRTAWLRSAERTMEYLQGVSDAD